MGPLSGITVVDLGGTVCLRSPSRFSNDNPDLLGRPPLLGEHTQVVLGQLGISFQAGSNARGE